MSSEDQHIPDDLLHEHDFPLHDLYEAEGGAFNVRNDSALSPSLIHHLYKAYLDAPSRI